MLTTRKRFFEKSIKFYSLSAYEICVEKCDRKLKNARAIRGGKSDGGRGLRWVSIKIVRENGFNERKSTKRTTIKQHHAQRWW